MSSSTISIIDKIINNKESLPKKQKKLSEYILNNYQSIGLTTIHSLSKQAGVGVSTIMRTIEAYGYDSFNDFKKDILNEAFPIDSRWTLKKTLEGKSMDTDSSIITNVWEGTVDILEKSLTPDLIKNFKNATNLVIETEQLNILGSRPYKAMALYLEQLLGEFNPRIYQLSHDIETLFDKILQLKTDEILLIFAFDPYSKRIVQAARLANKLGVKIILITDYLSCPIMPYATVTLEVKISKEQFSVAPIIALIEALTIEVGKSHSEEAIQKLTKLEEILYENGVTYSHK